MILTREQVEQYMAGVRQAQGYIFDDQSIIPMMLDTDAALRQRVEELKQHHDAVVLALRDVGWTAVESGSDFIIHLGEQVADLTARVKELDKQCQGYYGEASKGWTKFREAERQVADLTAKLAASERAAYDVNGTIEALKVRLAAMTPRRIKS